MELALLENHFQTGIGCYYHLLLKFQAEIKFNAPESFDFYLLTNDDTNNHVKNDHIILLKKNDTGMYVLIADCYYRLNRMCVSL